MKQWIQIWFQLDGCPAHYGKTISAWLNRHYPRRWIGRWGVLKQELQEVYSSSVNLREQLRNRIEAAVHQISPDQCLTATAKWYELSVPDAMLALLQEANILNNIYIKQVNKYNVN